MKKIIIFLMLLPNIVLAETIHTDYKPYLLNTDNYLEETDILKREEYKIYNTYKEEIEEKYLKLNESSIEYNIDYNDLIYEEKVSQDYNEYAINYETKCQNNKYQIRKIIIKNFNTPINLSEVKITYAKKDFSYGTKLVNYLGGKSFATDGDLYGNYVTLNENSRIEFYFFNDIDINYFKIDLYSKEQNLNTNYFEIIVDDKYHFLNEFTFPNKENNKISIHFDNDYEEFIKENQLITNNKCISYFNLKTPLYKHWKINAVLQNEYKRLNNEDLFLMNDFKTLYNYYKREKIEIVDNYVLKNQEFNLKDYIVFSSIPINELNIINNINYQKSGVYNLEIIYQDKSLIKKEIKYIKDDVKEVVKEKISTKGNYKEKDIKKNKTIKISKVPVNKTKSLNKKLISTVKQNKYQEPILIIVVSCILIILIIFECILLYVKRKYY